MEIILLERVEKLGQMGDVVTVRNGYARNFLLPQRKALRATTENRAIFETKKAQIEADNLKRRQDADSVSAKMTDMVITLIRAAGESNQLYGSVSARDVAEAVTQAGATIDRRQVRIDTPIKYLGLHPIRIALHPEVDVEITANVARSDDEAVLQIERGAAAPTAAERDAEVDAAFAAEQAAEYAAVQAEAEADAEAAPEARTADARAEG